jgi:hypothetical protein
METMQAFMRSGILSSRLVQIGEEEIPSIELARALLSGSPTSKENSVWAYGLVVEASGTRGGRNVMCTYRSHHPPAEEWGGESAYFKNVGIPL